MKTIPIQQNPHLVIHVANWINYHFGISYSQIPNRSLTVFFAARHRYVCLGSMPKELRSFTPYEVEFYATCTNKLTSLHNEVKENKEAYKGKSRPRFDVELRKECVRFYRSHSHLFSVKTMALLLGLPVGTLNNWIEDQTLFDSIYNVAKSRV